MNLGELFYSRVDLTFTNLYTFVDIELPGDLSPLPMEELPSDQEQEKTGNDETVDQNNSESDASQRKEKESVEQTTATQQEEGVGSIDGQEAATNQGEGAEPKDGNPQASMDSSSPDDQSETSDGASSAKGVSDIGESLRKMYEKRRELKKEDSKADFKDVPRLTQVQFIQLWKTLYDMFSDQSQEQDLYHSIATVGTLLLELGEVGKKFYLKKSSPSESSVTDTPLSCSADSSSEMDRLAQQVQQTQLESDKSGEETREEIGSDKVGIDKTSEIDSASGSNSELSTKSAPGVSSDSNQSFSKPDGDWSISFEQFIASMLTEPPLVEFFEKQMDVTESVAKLRNRRLMKRQVSVFHEEKKK